MPRPGKAGVGEKLERHRPRNHKRPEERDNSKRYSGVNHLGWSWTKRKKKRSKKIAHRKTPILLPKRSTACLCFSCHGKGKEFRILSAVSGGVRKTGQINSRGKGGIVDRGLNRT